MRSAIVPLGHDHHVVVVAERIEILLPALLAWLVGADEVVALRAVFEFRVGDVNGRDRQNERPAKDHPRMAGNPRDESGHAAGEEVGSMLRTHGDPCRQMNHECWRAIGKPGGWHKSEFGPLDARMRRERKNPTIPRLASPNGGAGTEKRQNYGNIVSVAERAVNATFGDFHIRCLFTRAYLQLLDSSHRSEYAWVVRSPNPVPAVPKGTVMASDADLTNEFFQVRRHGDIAVIVPSPQIEHLPETLLQPAAQMVLAPLKEDPPGQIIVDLSEVEYFGSAFITFLLRCHLMVKNRGSELVLAGVNKEIRELLAHHRAGHALGALRQRRRGHRGVGRGGLRQWKSLVNGQFSPNSRCRLGLRLLSFSQLGFGRALEPSLTTYAGEHLIQSG